MKTNMLDSATSLSNQDLLDRLVVLAGNERHTWVELVAHLAALHERPSLYEALGFVSPKMPPAPAPPSPAPAAASP